MNNRLVPSVEPLEQPPARLAVPRGYDPKILWPSVTFGQDGAQNEDNAAFPSSWALDQRQRADIPLALVAFVQAVRDASVRLLVLDRHFDCVGVDALATALEQSGVSDVRLLTGGTRTDEPQRARLNNCLNAGRVDGPQVEVQWNPALRKNRFPFLHDRFAIVDDALWHFGATVGGGHRSLTAASGPWSAHDTRAVSFFDECWRRLNA